MARTIIRKLIGSVLILTVAVLVTEEAASDFQTVVFLMALIGYLRLTSLIAEDHEASRIRYLRTETWFHRIDGAIRGTGPDSRAAASMVAGVHSDRELVELKQAVETLARSSNYTQWIVGATEVILLFIVAWVLLR